MPLNKRLEDQVMVDSFNAAQTLHDALTAEPSSDFSRYAVSYEVQAMALTRGLQTALFIEKFRRGMLRMRGRS